MPEHNIMMGIDYGRRKMGIAVGQTLTGTATPVSILDAKDGELSWQTLNDLIQQWRVDAIVVGIPLHRDGTETDMTQEARDFAARVEAQTGKTVYAIDEYLSTREALRILNQGNKRKQKQRADSMAAVIILESWLAGEL